MIGFYLLISLFSQFPSFGISEAHADVNVPATQKQSIQQEAHSKAAHSKAADSKAAPLQTAAVQPVPAIAAAPTIPSAPSAKRPFSLIVDFPEINGLRPGSPVLVEGNLVGHVKTISSKEPSKSHQHAPLTFEVALDLDSSFSEKLALGTCALQALPMTDSKSTRKPVVELFVPALDTATKLSLLRAGDRIPGYASYEEFWRSDTERHTKNS